MEKENKGSDTGGATNSAPRTRRRMTPQQRANVMLLKVGKAHAWINYHVSGMPPTYYFRRDECQICGLVRKMESDEQNGMDDYWTFSVKGQELTLAEAVRRGCPKVSEA